MYKVLIAEDEPLIRKGIMYCTDWAALNCSIPLEAGDGQNAVQMIRQHLPDIVLLDINMPLLSGIEVLRLTQEECGYVPIVVTGYAQFDYAQQTMRYGAQRYLLKPVDPGELTEAIRYTQRTCDTNRLLRYELQQQTDLSGILGKLPDEKEKSRVVCLVMAYVAQHYAEKVTIARMAQEFHYSQTLLIRRFKSETGINFSDYLTHYRLQKATEMMRQTDVNIVKISEQCGFSEYRYFRLVFQKKVGCSPKQYMQRLHLGEK